ncbi:MAG: T9SS type A sorting domain-containing protein [Bacteroidota bacterium]
MTRTTVHYRVDEGPLHSYDFEGWLGPNGSVEWVDLPPIYSEGAGSHRFTAYVALPGGLQDEHPANDTVHSSYFRPFRTALPFEEDFEAGLPATWLQIDNHADRFAIAATGSCETPSPGNQALTLINEFYHSPLSPTIYSPTIDLSGHSDATLHFDHAFARQDELRRLQYLSIAAIPVCEPDAAELVFHKAQKSMLEAIVDDRSFIWSPENCEHWTGETVDLSAYAGQEIVLAVTVDIGRYDYDRLYLDNFRVTSSYVEKLEESGLTAADIALYPVPANDVLHVASIVTEATEVELAVYDLLGQQVFYHSESAPRGALERTYDVSALAAGHYLARLRFDDLVVVRRVLIYPELN